MRNKHYGYTLFPLSYDGLPSFIDNISKKIETAGYKFFYILLKDSVDLQVRIRDLFGFSLVFLMPFIHRGMSVYVGHRSAYIILYLYLGVHLIKFAIYDKMLIL